MRAEEGTKFFFGSETSFTSKAKKGDKIGVLIDMFEGSIKFFINNDDKGYAYQNEKTLTETSLFVSIYAYGTGTFRFVQPPQSFELQVDS